MNKRKLVFKTKTNYHTGESAGEESGASASQVESDNQSEREVISLS